MIGKKIGKTLGRFSLAITLVFFRRIEGTPVHRPQTEKVLKEGSAAAGVGFEVGKVGDHRRILSAVNSCVSEKSAPPRRIHATSTACWSIGAS